MKQGNGSLVLLGLPTFGMAAAVTAVSSYLPVVLRGHAGSTVAIGGILATEGLLALWVPLVVGAWSDRLRTRLGSRLPFILAGTPAMLLSLPLLGVVRDVAFVAALVVVFFLGYFVAYEPYRALYPDLVPDEQAGRSQSIQAAWRGAGTGIALISGGLLLDLADFLPFVVYAVLLALSVGLFVVLANASVARADRDGDDDAGHAPGEGRAGRGSPLADARGSFALVARLLRERPSLRFFVLCNALWELALGAIKTFVVLYVTVGLGYSLGETSLLIGAAAVVVLLGALGSGALGDRLGRLRVVTVSVLIFGIGLLVPGLTTFRPALLVAVPLIALGGGTLMSLPYSLLMPLMPDGEHGAVTGLFALSRGVGVMAGPVLAGVAIEVLAPAFGSTEGYAAAWLVAGGAALLSLLPLRRLRHLAG
jgi:Na+/melibiose symporter-like transporter